MPVVVFLCFLKPFDILQGGPLMQKKGYIRIGHFLWKVLKFSLSPEPKSWIFNLDFIAQGVSPLVLRKCVSGLEFSSFHS